MQGDVRFGQTLEVKRRQSGKGICGGKIKNWSKISLFNVQQKLRLAFAYFTQLTQQ